MLPVSAPVWWLVPACSSLVPLPVGSPLGFAPIQIGLISLIIVTLIVTYATKPTSAETLEKFFPAKVKAK